jgi:hypothetical protein
VRGGGAATGLLVEEVVRETDEGLDEQDGNDNRAECCVKVAWSLVQLLKEDD